uniref:TNFR-Cys domain-containing protein n=1 Tax=Denticeps clupeoides TaxID=299321 RepID=A0AAY4DPN7_9TELE
ASDACLDDFPHILSSFSAFLDVMANRVTLYIFFQIMLIVWIDLACSSRLYRGTLGRARGARDVSCRESLGYTHDDMCCLKCPAGTYVKDHCMETFQRGSCEPCGFDTYTEHDNGLNQCLWCTKCRSGRSMLFSILSN